eukprot:CAMPEP_0185022740 /NCGR_PEP_ID=MMETSP1103-20130426/5437_1 /TAXON_ID=36769 /ORGANISM="Paraphysomonas bandaiensis, Strain Caron Lab Isolate" /LENGTH=623 /DNA_ID=CAMNT_0027554955 /DNA_START=437 /DNA_END=2308 /DNA_ORIENTATION=+
MASSLELISSTGYKEWTLFGLFVSLGVELVSWLTLIPIQQHGLKTSQTYSTVSVLYSLISLGLGSVVWVYMSYVPSLSSKRTQQKSDAENVYRVFRYDDAVYALSPEENDTEILPQSPALSGGRSYYSVDQEDWEVASLRLGDPSHSIVNRIMIGLHAAVTLIAFLVGQRVFGDLTESILFGVVVNPAFSLWQVCKVFMTTTTGRKITELKHQRNLLKAHKDTLKTLNTLSTELKWPASTIRGIVIPMEAGAATPMERTMRALLWAGHTARMLEVATEVALNSLSKVPRRLFLRHVIVTFGTCLNCQSLSAVKDMHTLVTVAIDNSTQDDGEGTADVRHLGNASNKINHHASGIAVVANHDTLLYGFLGLHSLIVKLADPHQEIKFGISIAVDSNSGTARVSVTVSHWGEVPMWSDGGLITAARRERPAATAAQLDRDSDALQTLVESIRDRLDATIASRSNGRLCSTSLKFSLPLGNREVEGMWKPRSMKSPWVLIIDDSKVCRKIVRANILRMLPMAQVEECATSKAAMTAVARCGSEQFDYILVDYVISSNERCIGGGVQLCAKIRQFTKHATIIGITGDNYGVALSDFLLNGADLAYLKPVSSVMLSEVFSYHLRGEYE